MTVPSGVPISDDLRAEILKAYEAGEPTNAIAERFGVARSTVTMSAYRFDAEKNGRYSRYPYAPKVLEEDKGRWVRRGLVSYWVPWEEPALSTDQPIHTTHHQEAI